MQLLRSIIMISLALLWVGTVMLPFITLSAVVYILIERAG